MPHDKDKERLRAMAMLGSQASIYLRLTPAERRDIISRSRLELFRLLTPDAPVEDFEQAEREIETWTNSSAARMELFWREPERAVRAALRSQLIEALAGQGIEISRLEGS